MWKVCIQAEALQAAGHMPDQVIMLEAPDLVLADRAKYRRIDPLTHHIFHLAPGSGALSGAITPTLPDGSPDDAATSRLVPRGDDSLPNVQHRLAAWTKHARFGSLVCPLQCCHSWLQFVRYMQCTDSKTESVISSGCSGTRDQRTMYAGSTKVVKAVLPA